MSAQALSQDIALPDEHEKLLAEQGGKELSLLIGKRKKGEISLVVQHGSKEVKVPLPLSAFHLFIRVLEQMALGNAVTLIPLHAYLTTQEAADLLNVSRPYLVKLLEEGKMPYHKVGAHRRIKFEDLMTYRRQLLAEGEKAMDELARLGQEIEQDQ